MFSPKKKLEEPESFDFPFVPYDIQVNLMKALYTVLENKEIGIFESPTGTGKSLTLATSSIKWLLDHNDLIQNEIQHDIDVSKEHIKNLKDDSNTKDWIEIESEIIEKKSTIASLIKLNESITEYNEKIRNIREQIKGKGKENISDNLTRDVKDINSAKNCFEDSEVSEDSENENEDDNKENLRLPTDVKLFFCSRTHSQLSQVVREIKRTKYGKDIRCISLASRQNLCINEEVRKLNSLHLMNEKCLEMQKKKESKKSESPPKKKAKTISKLTKCPFKNKNLIKDLKNLSISKICDIEDLVTEAKHVKACPYYSSRLAIKDAQVIMLPYQILFHRSTRIQSGVELKNNIIIIDEAHNLLDTISNIYSADLELTTLELALNQLASYKAKYFSRFSTKNLLKINQIVFIVKRLIELLKRDSKIKSRMIKSHELMSEGDFYNIDIFDLLKFCEDTHFAEKVHSFSQRYNRNFEISKVNINKGVATGLKGLKGVLNKLENETKLEDKHSNLHIENIEKETVITSSKNVIRPLLKFLESLTECADDGGIMIRYKCNPNDEEPAMKFVLLNPTQHFKEIVDNCRSIIIAGGTMQPINELTNRLFSNCIDRVRIHIYGHIVPDQSILPIVVNTGPLGKKLNFNFQNRTNSNQFKELAQIIFNISNVVPAGVVCFVPSYDYLDDLWLYLDSCNYLTRIENKKFMFRETKSTTRNESVEKLLYQYSKSVKDTSKNGAIIFSVVGGKLSEGLNFSDDLGRCVIVIGLPYPNITSFELQEKMKYLDKTLGKDSGSEYYENLCMKAVNQCIGRSIRHINDYAVVLLIDERYSQKKVVKKLPTWISKNLKILDNYGQIQRSIVQFFKEKNKNN